MIQGEYRMVKLGIILGAIVSLLIALSYLMHVLAEMKEAGIGFDPMLFDGTKLGPIGLCATMLMLAILLISSYILRKYQIFGSNEDEQTITGDNPDEKNNEGMT